VPDYRAVIQAVARRDKARVLVDGMTAAYVGPPDRDTARHIAHTELLANSRLAACSSLGKGSNASAITNAPSPMPNDPTYSHV
jgi:hypothetical protein